MSLKMKWEGIKPNYLLRSKTLGHYFYLLKVIIQVPNGNGVLNTQ